MPRLAISARFAPYRRAGRASSRLLHGRTLSFVCASPRSWPGARESLSDYNLFLRLELIKLKLVEAVLLPNSSTSTYSKGSARGA
jgi:hypothetical protein